MGGWFGSSEFPPWPAVWKQEPIVAMALAALLVDSARQIICPLAGDHLPADGYLGWQIPKARSGPVRTILVGVGAIGTYLATLVAVLRRGEHLLVDFDRIEGSNLNRQGLFTVADASSQAYKSLAAKE